MKTIKYTIQDALGIHARPAGLLAKKAKEYQSEMVVRVDGKKAVATKLYEMMGLAAKQGQAMVIEITGPDEEAAAVAMLEFLKANL